MALPGHREAARPVNDSLCEEIQTAPDKGERIEQSEKVDAAIRERELLTSARP
jgi:hypothetical protein